MKTTFANRKDKPSPKEVKGRAEVEYNNKISEGWAEHRRAVMNNKRGMIPPIPKWLLDAHRQEELILDGMERQMKKSYLMRRDEGIESPKAEKKGFLDKTFMKLFIWLES